MSGYERILVHLDSTERCADRLALACTLARRHKSRLIGLFAETDPAVLGVSIVWPTPTHKAATEASRDAFDAAIKTHDVTGEWHGVETGRPDGITQSLVTAARVADLTIIGQHDPEKHPTVPASLTEEVVSNAGTPVLVVPYAGTFLDLPHRAVVAWNGSREAAHALAGARALLKETNEAVVLEMVPEGRSSVVRDTGPWSDPVVLLAAWGIKGRRERLHASGIGIMDMLLSRLVDENAGLLVMGAHGHYGFPSLGRGKGTRYILDHMTVPALMAH